MTDEIRRTIAQWADALRAKDIDATMAAYAPGVVTFSLAPPLAQRGADRAGMQEWFDTWAKGLQYDVSELEITATEDVAYAHSLNYLAGTKTDGQRNGLWFRATLCLRKINGSWKIVHEHTSVPFYMDGSVRAAVDLKP
jgi:ketosteroid isomerase-like protein